jgi:lantibiotic modifying enzyme
MDAFFERLAVSAATIDELLSDDFQPAPVQKDDADRAARRLAAWCKASAGGDWALFARRLERDNLTFPQILERLAGARPRASNPIPDWVDCAIWILDAMQDPGDCAILGSPCPFDPLFAHVVDRAHAMVISGLEQEVRENLTEAAHADIRHMLLEQLSGLCAPTLYERFLQAAKAGDASRYGRFIDDMKRGGLRSLFQDKPVLLRLLASLTRQWIDAWREFLLRLAADLPVIRRELLCSDATKVSGISGEIADTHNGGRAVRIVVFEDGRKLVYKPKDLRLDVAMHALIGRFNHSEPPVLLRTARPLARDGYGWTEFIEHEGCPDTSAFDRFFRRAGAWLALFHGLAATDMHQENMIASGEHPVPIDLEMLLQPGAPEQDSDEPEAQAEETAKDIIARSVSAVGLLPAYGRSPDNEIVSLGGMNAEWNVRMKLVWSDINSDKMKPFRSRDRTETCPKIRRPP